jgi:FG-GAP-like repeat
MSFASLKVSPKAGRSGAVRALCIFGAVGFLLGAPAKAQTLPRGHWADSLATGASGFALGIRSTAGVADFDGDSLTDIAFAKPRGVVNGVYRYQVEVLLSGQPRTTFEVAYRNSGGGLHVTARDIDGDRDLDLVITTEFGREPVGVWINDGRGSFSQGDPAIYSSSIWQESKEALEGPSVPLRLDTCCVMPGGGCSAGPAGLPAPPLEAPGVPLSATSDGHVSHHWNLGRPLRAPPVL